MRVAVLRSPDDVRVEERDEPRIIEPTDAIIRISTSCVCGSDLWDYRGINPGTKSTPMGHEYCGIVDEVGDAVTTIKPDHFVIGSFIASDNTCPHCRAGYHTACLHGEYVGAAGAQAEALRVPRRMT
jgi:threonine dehydrogenase-like Zn-dependent dehydrogenase